MSDSDIVTAKAVAMVVLGGASAVLGLTPLAISVVSRRRSKASGGGAGGRFQLASSPRAALVISLLLAFGGGALLCTTFLHLLPEVREAVEELQETGVLAATKFHLAEFLMCAGFFTMYLVEELVHLYLHHRRRRASPDGALQKTLSKRRCSRVEASGALPSVAGSEVFVISADGDGEGHKADVRNGAAHLQAGHSHVHLPLVEGGDDDGSSSVLSSLRGLLIVLALSVHELFEGLSVGLQETAETVYYMMGAVAAHKMVLAFCVGVQLIAAGTRKTLIVIYVLTFALVSPIGIGVGLALGVEEGGSVETGAATTTLQGLACGTLLYVVFFEILQGDAKGIWQLLATAAGFFLMFGMLHVAVHDHSHSHDHGHEHEHEHEQAVTAISSLLLSHLAAGAQ